MPKGHQDDAPPESDVGRYWTPATHVLLVAVAVIMLVTVPDYGITWGEFEHARYGRQILSWYTSGFADRSALDDSVVGYLGGAFDLPATVAADYLPLDGYYTRHLMGVLVTLVGLLYTARLGVLLAGSQGGFFALLFLILTPRFYGHAFNNPTDGPLAAVTAVALFYLVRFVRGMPRPSWKDASLFGVAAGFALGLSIVSLALFLYLAVGLAVWLTVWLVKQRRTGQTGHRLFGDFFAHVPRLAFSGTIAAVIMFASWPAAQASPIGHVLRAIRESGTASGDFPVLYGGEWLMAETLPSTVLLRWLSLTLPESYAVALLSLGLVLITIGPRRLVAGAPPWRVIGFVVLALAVITPLGMQIMKGASVYAGLRHFLFMIPPLAVLAGASLVALWHPGVPAWVRPPVLVLVGVALAVTAADSWRIHPYQSIYFNRAVAGGLAGAVGRYETEFSGTSYKEGAEWIQSHYQLADTILTVASCGDPLSTSHFIRAPGFRYLGSLDEGIDSIPQVFVATNHGGCADRLQGTVVHQVSRLGVPILLVKEVPPGASLAPRSQGRSGDSPSLTSPGDTSRR